MCDYQSRSFIKNFIVINETKSIYCLKVYDKMINFDNDKFKGYLVDVKSQMKIMEEYRSNFFCKVCDVHQQKFFVLATKQILFSERQCMNMIENLEPMIKFLNIILLEYVDLLIEIKNCFDSDPRTTIHPIEGFLIKYKRRVPFF